MRVCLRLPAVLILLCFLGPARSQAVKKVKIGESGCSLSTYCDLKFDLSKSQDSSTIYTGECNKEGVTFGVICVSLVQPREDLIMAEDLMIAYLDYLKGSLGITRAAGYGKGHFLDNNTNTRGVLDYWEDREKNKWKVKAWTDGRYIGVMYAYSAKPLPENKVNIFLDGFRLPL